MNKGSKVVFIATMALLSYTNYAKALEVSFDKPGDTTGDLSVPANGTAPDQRLNIGGIIGGIVHNLPQGPGGPGNHGGPGGHGGFNPNPPAPFNPGGHGDHNGPGPQPGPGNHDGPGHHDGPGPQPGPWHPQPGPGNHDGPGHHDGPGPQPGPWHPQPEPWHPHPGPQPEPWHPHPGPQPEPWHPQPPMPPQPEPWYPPTPEPYNPQPPAPEYKEISLNSSGYIGRSFYLTFADAKAAYYKGSQIDLTVEAMALPAGSDVPANGLQQITVHGTYDVNSMYSIRLADNPKPGRYILTVKFARRSQGSVGAENSTIELLDIQ